MFCSEEPVPCSLVLLLILKGDFQPCPNINALSFSSSIELDNVISSKLLFGKYLNSISLNAQPARVRTMRRFKGGFWDIPIQTVYQSPGNRILAATFSQDLF